MTIWKHVQAIVLLPFTVTAVVPAVILNFSGVGGWAFHHSVPWNVLILAGAVVFFGLGLLVTTFRMFVQIGRGTRAPWSPTQRLVVVGVYRRVRNPMISGVMCLLLGEVIFFGSLPLFIWFNIFVVLNAIYIPLFEESGLEKRFGGDYSRYKENVPRWIPRLTPWEPDGDRRDGERPS